MNYIEVKIKSVPYSDTFADLISAFLGEIGFDSFLSAKEEISAYIQEPLFDEAQMTETFRLIPLDCAIDYTVTRIPDRNWNEEWEKNYFTPIVIGNECVIHSSFHTNIPNVKYNILIDPKMSFGTGHHETTCSMIEMMLQTSFDGKTVLDMGCGTAVLSILASLRKAQSVTGVDIDKWAYENARENVCLNHISNIEILLGGSEQIEGNIYDIILANINRNILLENMKTYASCMHTGSELYMSGFYKEDIPVICEEAAKHRLIMDTFIEKNRWVGTKFIKKSNI
ncbi:50S ribosomal protein L11 methyltransferase [Coprobacter sp.]